MKYQAFFVTGAPKSGTTWLGKILDAHPEISCKGEACVHSFATELGKAFRQYDDMLRSRAPAAGKDNVFPTLRKSDFMAMMRTFIELRLQVCMAPDKPRLRFVGEKDPQHSQHIARLVEIFPSAKVVNIVRDGRDVLLSAWNHNRWAHKEAANVAFDDYLESTAPGWEKFVRTGLEQGRRLGSEQYFELRYCDLLEQPEEWTRRLLRFLGADAGDEAVQQCVAAASFEALSEGRSAGDEDKAAFYRKGVAGEWRHKLTAKQIRRFNEIAGNLLRDLGYDLQPDSSPHSRG